jgi:hypothetical protein
MNQRRKDELASLYARLYDEMCDGRRAPRGERHVFVCDRAVSDGCAACWPTDSPTRLKSPSSWWRLQTAASGEGSGRASGSFDFFSCVVPSMRLFRKKSGASAGFRFSVRRDRIDDVRRKSGRRLRPLPGAASGIATRYVRSFRPKGSDAWKRSLWNLWKSSSRGATERGAALHLAGVRLSGFRTIGAGRTHGKYTIEGSGRIEAVGWGMAAEMAVAAGDMHVDLSLPFQ